MSTKTVLIVDDDECARDVMSRIVRRIGCHALHAEDGHAAQAVLAEHAVDAVLTDLTMPNCDGIELLLSLRSIAPHIPVIVASGAEVAVTSLPTARLLGAVTTLTKPFEVEQLITALQSALRDSPSDDSLCS